LGLGFLEEADARLFEDAKLNAAKAIVAEGMAAQLAKTAEWLRRLEKQSLAQAKVNKASLRLARDGRPAP
jgi:hypothetical protein